MALRQASRDRTAPDTSRVCFRAFTVHLAGRRLEVAHPEQVAFPDDGVSAIVLASDGRIHILDVREINGLEWRLRAAREPHEGRVRQGDGAGDSFCPTAPRRRGSAFVLADARLAPWRTRSNAAREGQSDGASPEEADAAPES